MKNMKVVEEPSPNSSPEDGYLCTSKALSNLLPIDDAARMDVGQIQEAFKTDLAQGLSDKEADARRKRVGPNEFKEEGEESLFSKFLDKLKEPMILLLLGSAVVSLLVKQYDDAASITLAVLIVCTVGFVQEYRSDKALESLKSLTKHKATVYREGVLRTVDASELIPGDLVQLNVGDRVPADIRLIEVVRLSIEESIFTGEVNPASKISWPLTTSSPPTPLTVDEQKFPKAIHVHELKNIAFMGTLVANGNGKGVVVNTGSETELGKIAALLKELGEKKTPLQEDMERLSEQISKFSFGIVAIIFIIGVVTGKPWLEMFTMGISLAVAAIPEGLPIVVTVTLAMGVIRMAKRNAIVRKLPSVESLGACNVICVDKTGTLTKNEMTVVKTFTYADPDSIIDVKGTGYQTTVRGFFSYPRDYGVRAIVGDQHKKAVEPASVDHLRQLFTIGALCNNANLNPQTNKLIGQPTEGALLAVALKAGIDRDSLYKNTWEREEEIPFSSEEKWMAVKCKNKETAKETYFVKGAAETILQRCTHYYVNDRETKPLTQSDKQKIISVITEFSDNALRVMTLAYGDDIIGGLTFAGLMGLYDPPREGVQAAIEKLRKGGVKVVMITGDSKHTAISIAKQLSIIDADERDVESIALSVEDLQDEKTFDNHVDRAVVFYRMAPVHKMKIVEAYQKLEYVVAMTGDGVNDAPALKLANIGIAMGLMGTDVSKEASEMILADDNFPTIMIAIEEGKSIFSNIKNFLRYQLTTSVSCMAIIIICTFFGLPLPLNPMQILWINIIMDGPPAQSLGVEPVDEDVMRQPPRDTKKNIINRRMILSIVSSSIIMVIGTMFIFIKEMELDGRVTNRDTTMTFTTFVMFQIFNAFNCRSEKKSVFQIGIFSNTAFNWCVGGCVVGQLLLIYTGAMNFIFETERLSMNDIILIFAITSTVWIFDEILKYFFRNGKNEKIIEGTKKE